MAASALPGKYAVLPIFLLTALFLFTFTSATFAEPNFFNDRCVSCHFDDSPTCNGCHQHGNRSLRATPDKSSYEPGEEVTITFDGGQRDGWVRGRMIDIEGSEIARKTGPTFTGNDGGPMNEFPMVMKGYAPGEAGNHTWTAKYFGNENGGGHSEINVPVTIAVSRTADIVVNAIPSYTPMFFSPTGGLVDFDVSLDNTTQGAVSFDGWIDATLPNGVHYGPVFGPVSATLPGGFSLTQNITLNLPGAAPSGVYSLNIYIGDYTSGTIIDSDSFAFVKM